MRHAESRRSDRRRMMRPAVVGSVHAVLLIGNVWLQAQSQTNSTAAPKFEVVSIKVNRSGPQWDPKERPPYQAGGRFMNTYVALRSLISNAYRLEVEGGPSWLDEEHYDITAKAEGNPSVDEMRLMLRTMFADRFKLVVHREQRESPVFTLTLARDDRRLGPRMIPSTGECATATAMSTAEPPPPPPAAGASPPPPPPAAGASPPPRRPAAGAPPPPPSAGTSSSRCGLISVGLGQLMGHGIDMTQLARLGLQVPAGRIVVDRTGLTGNFDVDLEWAPESRSVQTSTVGDAPSIFTAVQEQLGLRLNSDRGIEEVLIVDSVQRPTEN